LLRWEETLIVRQLLGEIGVEQMLRKIMSVITLSSVPVLSFGVAQLATSGNAFAAGLTTCSGGTQTVTFAQPGISNQGSAQASKKSTSTTSASPSLTCTGKHAGSGTVAGSVIKTKSTLTCSADTNAPAACTGNPSFFVYDSATQFVGGSSKLFKAVKTTTWTVGSTTYVAANTASKTAGSGSGVGNCPSTEAGFELTGHLTAPASQSGKATTITACLNTDTGTATTGNFRNDITSEVLGNKTITVFSAAFDGAASSIQFA
jgi:hypothetical protein